MRDIVGDWADLHLHTWLLLTAATNYYFTILRCVATRLYSICFSLLYSEAGSKGECTSASVGNALPPVGATSMLRWAHQSHCRLLCCRKTHTIPQFQAVSKKNSGLKYSWLLPLPESSVGAGWRCDGDGRPLSLCQAHYSHRLHRILLTAASLTSLGTGDQQLGRMVSWLASLNHLSVIDRTSRQL